MSAYTTNEAVYLGPVHFDHKDSFQNLITLNRRFGNSIQHFPQILETGRIETVLDDGDVVDHSKEIFKDEQHYLVNFGTYTFVLPESFLSPFDSENAYSELLDELTLLYYDIINKLIYIRPPMISDPDEFKKKIKEGIGFNHPDILCLTKQTVTDLLHFYIETSDLQSLSVNDKNLSIGLIKILYNYIQYKEDHPETMVITPDNTIETE